MGRRSTRPLKQVNKDNKDTIKNEFLEVLAKNMRNVTQSCKEYGLDRNYHYDWLKDDPEYKEKFDKLIEDCKDYADSKIRKLIETGSIPTTIYYHKWINGIAGNNITNIINVPPNIEIIRDPE